MLTPRLHRLLTFIEQYIEDHGYAPTLAEMAFAGMGSGSQGNVSRQVGQLGCLGYIRRIPGQHRGIEVIRSLKGKIVPAHHVCPHCGEALSVSLEARAA